MASLCLRFFRMKRSMASSCSAASLMTFLVLSGPTSGIAACSSDCLGYALNCDLFLITTGGSLVSSVAILLILRGFVIVLLSEPPKVATNSFGRSLLICSNLGLPIFDLVLALSGDAFG